MSLRTTLVLLALLAAAGGAIWWFTREEAQSHGGRNRVLLPGVVAGEVASLVVTGEQSDVPLRGTLSFSKSDAGAWMMRKDGEDPVRARSERVLSALGLLRDAAFVRELGSAEEGSDSRYGLAPGQRVVVTITDTAGRSRTLELGAQVSRGGVAARVDGSWPPVEVDSQIKEDLGADAEAWRERRLAPFDPSAAQAVAATFSKRPDAGFRAARESGRWEIREPALLKADQGLIVRLIASLSSLEALGPFESEGAPPEVLVRYEVVTAGTPNPHVIEIGDAREGDLVPARGGEDRAWRAVSLAGLELITQPGAHFRSRRLIHVEPEDMAEVVVTRPDAPPIHLKRAGPRMLFQPPKEWGWELLGRPRAHPVDPTAQADFLRALAGLEAADFDGGGEVEPLRTIAVHSKAGGPPLTIQFGRDRDGVTPFSRFGPGVEGHVRTTDLGVLDRPFFDLLARHAYNAAWFSLTTIEVSDPRGRKATISAVSTSKGQPDFVLVEPHGEEKRRVPLEIANPVAEKLSLLTVDAFVAQGRRPEFGLDEPAYRIRWLDSGQNEGTAPDTRVGHWVTWSMGPAGPDSRHHGEVSSYPGLVFKTGAADLDPFLSLLEWAYR